MQVQAYIINVLRRTGASVLQTTSHSTLFERSRFADVFVHLNVLAKGLMFAILTASKVRRLPSTVSPTARDKYAKLWITGQPVSVVSGNMVGQLGNITGYVAMKKKFCVRWDDGTETFEIPSNLQVRWRIS